ncbi:hypothetical protein KM043_013253 [Ampulex compressa]|nr:hypothetical protein KM043_013253 [Ampulex compressa]
MSQQEASTADVSLQPSSQVIEENSSSLAQRELELLRCGRKLMQQEMDVIKRENAALQGSYGAICGESVVDYAPQRGDNSKKHLRDWYWVWLLFA